MRHDGSLNSQRQRRRVHEKNHSSIDQSLSSANLSVCTTVAVKASTLPAKMLQATYTMNSALSRAKRSTSFSNSWRPTLGS